MGVVGGGGPGERHPAAVAAALGVAAAPPGRVAQVGVGQQHLGQAELVAGVQVRRAGQREQEQQHRQRPLVAPPGRGPGDVVVAVRPGRTPAVAPGRVEVVADGGAEGPRVERGEHDVHRERLLQLVGADEGLADPGRAPDLGDAEPVGVLARSAARPGATPSCTSGRSLNGWSSPGRRGPGGAGGYPGAFASAPAASKRSPSKPRSSQNRTVRSRSAATSGWSQLRSGCSTSNRWRYHSPSPKRLPGWARRTATASPRAGRRPAADVVALAGRVPGPALAGLDEPGVVDRGVVGDHIADDA